MREHNRSQKSLPNIYFKRWPNLDPKKWHCIFKWKHLSIKLQNLKFICRLRIPVDEAEPHGGGVWVEKLKLKSNIYLTCCFLLSMIKDLLEFLSPELSNHLAELCTLMILRCSLLLCIWEKNLWDCGTLFKVGHWQNLVLQRWLVVNTFPGAIPIYLDRHKYEDF